MEDTTMTKKYYIAPELDILDAETDEILMVSSIVTTGLGDDPSDNLVRDDENPSGDSWGGAW